MTKRKSLHASLKIAEHYKLFRRDKIALNPKQFELIARYRALKKIDPKEFNSYGEYVNYAVTNGIPLTRILRQKMINYDFKSKNVSTISEISQDDKFFSCRRGHPPDYTI